MSVHDVAVIVGTRPELVKMAPVLHALEAKGADYRLVHTGQHYDANMSAAFLRDLALPEPHAFLGIGSCSHARQTADAMVRIEAFLHESPCRSVLVQGDTNTVLAGALVATKMGVDVGHVEAGLRSYDRRMPEEHNRVTTDHLASHLFAPTERAAHVLRDERVAGSVHVTGNTVIDAVNFATALADLKATVTIPEEPFALVTAHRAENVDDPRVLSEFVDAFTRIPLPVVYPVHPRTRHMLDKHGLLRKLADARNVVLIDPVGYFDMLALMQHARMILTDSGGIQEEATAPAVRKRVFVLRQSTERPEAEEAGFATIVGTRATAILDAVSRELEAPAALPAMSPFGDGRAGKRIAELMLERQVTPPRRAPAMRQRAAR